MTIKATYVGPAPVPEPVPYRSREELEAESKAMDRRDRIARALRKIAKQRAILAELGTSDPETLALRQIAELPALRWTNLDEAEALTGIEAVGKIVAPFARPR